MKASKPRAGWHRLALTPTVPEVIKRLLKLISFYNVNTPPSSLLAKQRCGKCGGVGRS
jgi:hypothetical protein